MQAAIVGSSSGCWWVPGEVNSEIAVEVLAPRFRLSDDLDRFLRGRLSYSSMGAP